MSEMALHLLKRSPVFGLVERLHEWMWHRRASRAGTFAQHREDRFVLDYFGGRVGTYIDVGASHPFKISNTYALYQAGWRGVTMEPIPRLHRRHCRLRPDDVQLMAAAGESASKLRFFELTPGVLSTFDEAAARSAMARGKARLVREYEVDVLPLASVHATHLAGRPVDFLSIDAEGFELPILRGIDWDAMHVRLIACEIRTPDEDAPRAEVADFLKGKGYRLVKTLGCNGMFERAD